MNSDDVKRGAPPCVGPNGTTISAALQINELTLAQRMAMDVERRCLQITRAEAQRCFYRAAEIDELLPS
jgi:hypothetical protein